MIGGLTGNSNVPVDNCSAHGDVIATSINAGGLIGSVTATASGGIDFNILISNCYNTGNVSGTDYIGGLIGRSRADISMGFPGPNSNITIQDCFNEGNVQGTARSGGIIGSMNSDSNFGTSAEILIMNSYSRGNLATTATSGGLVGEATTPGGNAKNTVVDRKSVV